MSEKSGFFNSLLVSGDYDRKYNANDYSDNLAVVMSNGVLRSVADDLKVTASGMVATVNAGRAWIEGHYYYNDSQLSFPAVTAPVGGNRYDRVMLRLNKSINVRNVSLVYVQGTAAASPTKPAPTRTTEIYDLVLADIYVATNATSVVVTDTRSDNTICGWLYSTSGDNSFFTSLDNSFHDWFSDVRDELASVTLFKRYTWSETLAAAGTTVAFNIPQYDADTCFIEVFVNGILDSHYTQSNNVLTFSGTLTAGTVVTVKCYKSIDGTGIMSVSEEITILQNAVAALQGVSKFTYTCTGSNDNIALSQIAQAFYDGSYIVGSLSAAAEAFLTGIGGNTYLATLTDEFQATINVTGTLGATTPYAGSGTSSSRYRYFSLGVADQTAKRIVFDFAKCPKINITCSANTDNIIFYGTDMFIRNATVIASSSAASCHITMAVGSTRLNTNFENCRFIVRTTGKSVIANYGNFINCDMHVKSSGDNAFCIDAKSAGLTRLYGGTYFAYTGSASKISSVLNVENTETNAVILADNLNCPVIAQSGYYQNFYARHNAGKTIINSICTTMNPSGSVDYIVVRDKISINKQ